MTAPSRLVDTNRALRMSGFICQTLNDRGIRCTLEDLRWALPLLRQDQYDQIEAAVQDMAKGHDQQSLMELTAALRRLSSPSLRAQLGAAGIALRLDVLFEMATMATTRDALSQALAGLSSMQEAARLSAADKLRAWCGGVPVDDELPALPHEDAGTPTSAAPAPDGTPPPLRTSVRAPANDDGPADDACSPALPAEAVIRRKAKVFGKSGALTLEIAPVREQEHHASTARCTVMVEGALATGDGHFDWSPGKKVVFMCTQRELPQLLAVLMGWTSELEFKFHGANNKKSLHIAHQEHGLLVHVRDATKNVRVPVEDADRYALAMLVLAAMAHNEPHLDSSAIMAVARAMAVVPGWRRAG
ncbi:hypothetical protein RQP54_18100 [Curvibacter sp. APW13]|uniref:hypothetical protein n=1 Tax=Curvibacter sp. APW13 TaxID=3077236 RepID=UPI0028DFB87B|nr:hypothetical protein [Curvibacter sp. APW13]MDT8992791.1 hypothetical protein [Curvibacter sp. APW13]